MSPMNIKGLKDKALVSNEVEPMGRATSKDEAATIKGRVNPKLLGEMRDKLKINKPTGMIPENFMEKNLSRMLFSVRTKIATSAPAESSQALLIVRK